jgi:hypothetical protein
MDEPSAAGSVRGTTAGRSHFRIEDLLRFPPNRRRDHSRSVEIKRTFEAFVQARLCALIALSGLRKSREARGGLGDRGGGDAVDAPI